MASVGKGSSPIDFGKIVVSAYHERGREKWLCRKICRHGEA